MASWGSILSLFAFFFLVISMFAVFGMQLYGDKYGNFNDGKPRSNFDSFPRAWLTIFQVTSGDEWMAITWEAMRLQQVTSIFLIKANNIAFRLAVENSIAWNNILYLALTIARYLPMV